MAGAVAMNLDKAVARVGDNSYGPLKNECCRPPPALHAQYAPAGTEEVVWIYHSIR